jgi:hypothetical protein
MELEDLGFPLEFSAGGLGFPARGLGFPLESGVSRWRAVFPAGGRGFSLDCSGSPLESSGVPLEGCVSHGGLCFFLEGAIL